MRRAEPRRRAARAVGVLAIAVLGAISYVLAGPAAAHVGPAAAHAAPTPHPSGSGSGGPGNGGGGAGGPGGGGAAQQAQAGGPSDLVVLSGDVAVRQGETSGDVVVIHGSVRVAGVVRGDVVVVDGPITVAGLVRGDVVALDGDVALVAGGHVTGDVTVANGTLTVQVGSVIDGQVHRGGLAILSPAKLVTKLAFWIAISVSTLLLGLLLVLLGPRAGDAVARAGRTAVGASIGWGAVVLFGLPVVSVLLLVSLVGLPFGIGLLLALALVYAVGYVYGAWWIGRLIVRPSRHGGPRRLAAFLAGWAILRVVGFVPVLGGITWFLAAWYGLGAATVALWRARREPVPRMESGRAEPGFTTGRAEEDGVPAPAGHVDAGSETVAPDAIPPDAVPADAAAGGTAPAESFTGSDPEPGSATRPPSTGPPHVPPSTEPRH